MSTISSLKTIKNNKYGGNGSKDFMEKFCESLKERGLEITNFKKRKMKLLTKNSRNYMKMQKFVVFVKKIKINMLNIKS